MEITEDRFGTIKDGQEVSRFTISNTNGISVSMISYGGIITAIMIPDRRGATENVVLSFDTLEEYISKSPYFGALVGRFANRIAKGCFVLDGSEYRLACNDVNETADGKVANHLHGGNIGLDKVVWNAEPIETGSEAGVKLSYLSPDMDEGYPGNLEINVSYTLSEENELSFEYRAQTDKPTPVNLTNHTYWNLAGAGSGDILRHELMLNCTYYLVVDNALIPTGEVRKVEDTPMDFVSAKPIGRDMSSVPGGYDHCFVAESTGDDMKPIASVNEPGSGRRMEMKTTSNPPFSSTEGTFWINLEGAGGAVFVKHGALCLETEHFPDAVNHPNFPSCILRPGEVYHHKTVHAFSTG